MIRVLTVFTCATLLISQAGCSFLGTTTQTISVTASDPKAEILVNGEAVGFGRVTCELKRGKTHTFMARRGDRVGRATLVPRNRSTLGQLDFLGGCFLVIPFLGLLSPGAYEFSTSDVPIILPNVTVIEGK